MAVPLQGKVQCTSDDLESEESVTWNLRDNRDFTSRVRSNARRTKFHRLQRLSHAERDFIAIKSTRRQWTYKMGKMMLIKILKMYRKWEIIALMRKELDQSVNENKAKWSMNKLDLALRWMSRGNPAGHASYWQRSSMFAVRHFMHGAPYKPIQSVHRLASLDVNTCSESQLKQLKGIGPCLAKRIVTQRNVRAFTSAADLIDRVKGIGSTSWRRITNSNATNILFR